MPSNYFATLGVLLRLLLNMHIVSGCTIRMHKFKKLVFHCNSLPTFNIFLSKTFSVTYCLEDSEYEVTSKHKPYPLF
jgi:hypothetical protein